MAVSPAVDRIVDGAAEVAKEQAASVVTTEHLLVSLLRAHESTAYSVLRVCGVDVEDLRARAEEASARLAHVVRVG